MTFPTTPTSFELAPSAGIFPAIPLDLAHLQLQAGDPLLFNFVARPDEADRRRPKPQHQAKGAEDSRARRNRTAFSDAQLEQLERAFRRSQYPDVRARDQLCKSVGLPESKIQVWFKNRRAKHRKHLRNLPNGEEKTAKVVETEQKQTTEPTVISWTPDTFASLCNPLFYPGSYTSGFLRSS